MISYRDLIKKSWPIILANAAVPLLGLVDTAVIGNFGTAADLGAIAFGAIIFNFIYWSFGFLRMATTGFVAIASGAADEEEVRAAIGRSILLATFLGLALIILQKLIAATAFSLISSTPGIQGVLEEYYYIRIWSAPATLCTFAILGLFVGLGSSGKLLAIQLVLNGINIVMDLFFAGYLDMGVRGIALGTLIAEWCAFIFGTILLISTLKSRSTNGIFIWPWDRIKDLKKFIGALQAKSHILIRTIILMFGFAYFIKRSSEFGDAALAANHILLQFITFSAFFIDAYAFVIESLVGKAVGAKDLLGLKVAIKNTTVLAAITASMLALLILTFGSAMVFFLTDLPEVRQLAVEGIVYSALYVFFSFPAFQLDGIFIGASLTRQMRDASAISFAVFMFLCWLLVTPYGMAGLWYSFIIFVCARAAALLFFYGDLMVKVSDIE